MSPKNKKADLPVTFRAYRLTNRKLIPIAQALEWDQPDPYNNKTIVDFLFKLIDLCYEKFVEKYEPANRDLEEAVAALKLVSAYTEGLGEVPAALKPAVEISEKFSSA